MAITARITQTGRSYRRWRYLCRNVSFSLILLASLGVVPQAIALEANTVTKERAISGESLVEESSDSTPLDETKESTLGTPSNDSPSDEDEIASDDEADTAIEETDAEVEGKIVTVDMPLAEVAIDEAAAIIPDVTQLTLDAFKLVEGEESAADVLTLGDLSDMLDLRNMTVGSAIVGRHRNELQTLTLDQYEFLGDMTISEVADMAGLHFKTVGEIPIVETAILTFLNHPVLVRERKVTLSLFLSRYPEIGSIKLSLLELPEYHYSAIPKLLSVPITSIPNWRQLKVSSIVGLRDLPIHQNLQIDGEIVTLTTTRTGKRTEIQLIKESGQKSGQGAGFSAAWSEELDEQALRPFGSFFLKPMIAGETIRIDAYFKSCTGSEGSCAFIGPFAYPNYKVGDRFYVSQSDWREIIAQEQQTIEFIRESTPVAEKQTATLFDEQLLKIVAISVLAALTGGISVLFWLLSRNRKEAKP